MFVVQKRYKKCIGFPIRTATMSELTKYENVNNSYPSVGVPPSEDTEVTPGVPEYDGTLAEIKALLAAHSQQLENIENSINGSRATMAKKSLITLFANGWMGEASPYYQIVSIEGITENSQVDLTLSAEQFEIFRNKDLAFVAENEDGTVVVYANGQKPQNDYTIQVTITEVAV